ncbi:MAG: PfaD family polyunsaturated fatty acid/polyketide biosynthesis protein [Myxococcales bacterium]
MNDLSSQSCCYLRPRANPVGPGEDALSQAIQRIREPLCVVHDPGSGVSRLSPCGELVSASQRRAGDLQVTAMLPATRPESLGDRAFREAHGVRFAYVAGEMANGISTTRMVIEMARAGMLGFFGAGGLSYGQVQESVTEITSVLGGSTAWGVNLIHSPNEPELEERVAELLIAQRVPRISASAFMALTPSVVLCSAAGLRLGPNYEIIRPRHVFAKVSRPEVAAQFMSPAPRELLRSLVARGKLTESCALLAERIPVAEDVTVEADSGGHTDNRPLVALLPLISALRDELVARFRYTRRIRVGAAGGLGTPWAIASAFALNAAYVVTGSVNQSAVEAGISPFARQMLAEAGIADVAMAAAADMFEQGVQLQVLKRGTLFAARANSLYALYRTYESLESLPPLQRAKLEKALGASLVEVWRETEEFWWARDPAQIERARSDPKHKMALLFRWYLGKSSRWAITGDAARRADYQILVWSGDGCLQRLGQGLVPRASVRAHRGPDCPEPAGGGGGGRARAAGSFIRSPAPSGGQQVHATSAQSLSQKRTGLPRCAAHSAFSRSGVKSCRLISTF